MIVAICLIVMVAFVGFALDTARIYNRRAELHNIANAAAIAAATQLNGTPAGINAAAAAAAAVMVEARFDYSTQSVTWSDSALQFATSPPPGANWTSLGAALAAPSTVFYAKVDVSALGNDVGAVQTFLMRVLPNVDRTVSINHVAIAGRTAINVTPLAICALSANPVASRSNPGPPANTELVEFGFRRGVSYDLMQLNSNGTSGESFVVDPISPPGSIGTVSRTSDTTVRPFLCTGSMWMPHLAGAVTVARPFRLASLYMSLNSRFGQYDGSCKPNGAPPDFNVKAYTYTAGGGASWMTSAMSGQSAASLASNGKLWTVADPDPLPGNNTTASYGPLWAYARAVPYSAYVAGSAEPAAGYGTFLPSAWPTLYKPGPTFSNYPTSASTNTPYLASSGAYFSAPPPQVQLLAARQRRVLNLPLVACPVAAGSLGTAQVLGIGKFFMTVPATATSIHAEFAGALKSASNGGQVELL